MIQALKTMKNHENALIPRENQGTAERPLTLPDTQGHAQTLGLAFVVRVLVSICILYCFRNAERTSKEQACGNKENANPSELIGGPNPEH